MSALVLTTVMDALATATSAASGIDRAYAYPVEAPQTPCVVVGYPEDDIEFDMTFGRGADRAVFPVWAVLGLWQDANTRTAVSNVINAATDVKTKIEASTTLLALGAIRVTGARVEAWTMGRGETPLINAAVRFTVEVTA